MSLGRKLQERSSLLGFVVSLNYVTHRDGRVKQGAAPCGGASTAGGASDRG